MRFETQSDSSHERDSLVTQMLYEFPLAICYLSNNKNRTIIPVTRRIWMVANSVTPPPCYTSTCDHSYTNAVKYWTLLRMKPSRVISPNLGRKCISPSSRHPQDTGIPPPSSTYSPGVKTPPQASPPDVMSPSDSALQKDAHLVKPISKLYTDNTG